MGKEEELQKKKKKSSAPVMQVEQPTYEEVQNPAWMMVDQSKLTSEGTGKNAATYAAYDKYDLKQLRDVLFLDKGSKSETFMDMYNAVNDLINLAITGGKYEVEGKKLTADFFETFYTARMHVSHYLYTRDGFHWTGKGENRVQVVRRISGILGKLNTQIEEYKASLTPEKARMLEYKQQNLTSEEIEQREERFRVKEATEEMLRIASTGEYGPKLSEKERTQMATKWIVGGFSESIRQLLEGQSMDELMNKDDFIAFIQDRNNRMLANRMAVSMVVEKTQKITSGTPWMRERLAQFVMNGIGDESMFDLKPDQVADKALSLIDDFENANKDLIEKTANRVKTFSKELHIPADVANLYDYPIMKQLIDETDDSDFDQCLNTLRERQRNTDEMIRQMLETRFSVATRDVIASKLIRNLGALRLFGNETQILDQCETFFGMIRYIAPLEYQIEISITNTMKDLKLDLSCRDHFVKTVSGGDPKQYMDRYLEGSDAFRKYAKNAAANTKTFLKKADDKATSLTLEQWEVIEKLRAKGGEYDSESFNELFNQTIAPIEGEKLSRREFLSKRKFKDAQKTPAMLRKVRLEKNRIEKLNDSLDNRFMFHLAGGSLDANLPYRKLGAIYKGQDKQLKVAEAREAERLKDRTSELKNVLRENGLSVPEMKIVIERFTALMKGMRDIDDEMNDDVRYRNQRHNLERYGVGNWQDALIKIGTYAGQFKDGAEPEEARIARERYENRISQIGALYNSKYKLLADLLPSIPDIRNIIMDEDEKKFDRFLNHDLEAVFAPLAEAMKTEEFSVPEAVRKSYAYAYMKDIYQGKITGNSAFFSEQLKGYSTRVLKVRPDGLNSASDNIKAAEKIVKKELSKSGLNANEADAVRFAVLGALYEMGKDPEGLLKMYDADEVKKYAKEKLAEIRASLKHDEHIDDEDIQKARKIDDEFYDLLPDIKEHEQIEKIEKEKKKGRRERSIYLGLDTAKIARVRAGKSLIRVKARGDNSVSLDTSLSDKMRGLIKEYCGDLELPPVLVDALVEEGASQSIRERLTGTRWWSGTLYKHAFSMAKMYSFLKRDRKDDPAMGDEEAQMFIVKSYGDKNARKKLFENAKGPNMGELRTSPEYLKFRADYKKLRAFESIELDEPSLERERMEIAMDLRTILMTGVGSTGADMAELTDKASSYIRYSAQVTECIRKRVERFHKGKGLSELYIDRQVDALRDYYMNTMLGEIVSGGKFVAKDWNEEITRFYSDQTNRDHIEFSRNALSSEEEQKVSQSGTHSKVTEKDIADTIRQGELLFNGRLNKYEKLDEDQKKLFVIALMMMDKGAIGMGAAGTASLLAPRDAKAKETEHISLQINNYVAGGELNVNLNYKEALYKLINYGKNNVLDPEHFTFSVTAYNKALQFAQAISAKKLRYGVMDMQRLSNGYTSINAAFVNYGKKNQQVVDSLPSGTLTIDDVRQRLISFADGDMVSKKDMAMNAIRGGAGNIIALRDLDRDRAKNVRLNKIKKRLNKLSDSELKVFTRLMQERTIFDKSYVEDGSNKPHVVDQEKRDALEQALSSDAKIRAEVLEGFDDPESCKQALTSALSFKLRDDLVLKDKTITKDCFDKESFNRDTLVDWTLIENALDLMDSINEKKMAAHAMSHAVDYIAFSGNKAAVDGYVKLLEDYKEKDKFKQDNFEKLISEHAKKDDSEDITRAVSGYHALSDREKNLFFKVLARRDFLDISRINYKSSYMGWAEREYANKAGRNALIDEYIDSNLEGNIGIQLDDRAYFNAMASLFTTQVSDRTNFSKTKDLTKIFANERHLFRGRGTAIDWKLFKRALQFVNRASEELEFAEGNAQLYRGAGELSKNGHINMDYSFLRKNIHRTGNHWARTITRVFGRTAKDIVGGYKLIGDVTLDKIIDVAGTAVNIADDVTKLALREDGYVHKGTSWLRKKKDSLQDKYKKLGENPTDFNIQALGVKEKEKTAQEKAEEAAKEAKRREELDYVGHLQDGIDTIIAQSKSAKGALDEVASYLKTNVIANSDKLKWFREVEGVSATQDSDNMVAQATEKAPVDTSYGDWRDDGKKVVKTAGDVKKIGGDVVNVVKSIPVIGDGVKEIEELIKNSTQKIAYKFLNDALIHNDIDLSPKVDENGNTVIPDELAEYQKNAEQYAKETFTTILNATIGEENAQKLLDAENYLYSIKDTVGDTIKAVVSGVSYVKRCAVHAQNIVKSAENIGAIRLGSKNAKALRGEDDAKLKKASKVRLTPEQAEIVEKITSKHRALKGVAEDVATAVQAFNISEDIINLAIDTATTAGGKLGVGYEAIAKAIKGGLEFAMYAARLATDRAVLNDYFRNTDAGKAVVDKLSKGFDKTGHKALKDANALNLIDIISDAKGYEHTSELIENTGMSVAQSIVFSASNYNPLGETRLMAITVMCVMGLEKEIGDTSPATVEKLFKGFKMAR